MTWAELRDASAAVQLAVQMLLGPLAPWNDPPPDPARLRDVLKTLEGSTRRVNELVAALQPAKSTGTSMPMPMPAGSVPPIRARKHNVRSNPPPPKLPCTHVATVLRDIEAGLTATGPRVSIHVRDDLHAACDAASLGLSLVAMIADAAALGPADAVVELRAYAELAEALGDEMDVVFEVRPDPRVPHARAFRPATNSLPAGARLEVHGQGTRPRACLRIAAPRPARILAA